MIWSQSSSSQNSTFSPGENGYLFIPSSTGRINNISAVLSTYGTTITWRLRIRSGQGVLGEILFSQDFTFSTGMSATTYNFNFLGPIVFSSNYYTWSLEVISGSLSNARNIGIMSDSTYIAYNTSIYLNTIIDVVNCISIYTQQISDTQTDYISTSLKKGFLFTPEGDSPRALSSVDILLTSYESTLSGRNITVEILEGDGLGGTLIFSGTQLISNISSKTVVNFSLIFPVLIPGNNYTITFEDTTGSNTGVVYFYGISSISNYVSYNTSVYPQITFSTTDNNISTFTQSINQTITENLSTIEKGFEFIPSISGQLSTIVLSLSSFEAIDIGRSINLKIYNGSGFNGSIVYNGVFTIPNYNVRTDFTLSINTLLLSLGNIYTISLIDITSGSTNTGNVYLYGVSPNLTYVSNNLSVYPKTTITASNLKLSYTQLSNPSVTDIVSTTTEQGFLFSPVFTSNIAGISLNISSYDSSMARTLRVRIRNGSGILGTILSEKIISLSNRRVNLDISIDIPSLLQQGETYTATIMDISPDINGTMSIYGIQSTTTYVSINTSVYPKFTTYGYTYVITISPPKKLTGFLGFANGVDNIEFNSQAFENASSLMYNGLPHTESHYYQIGLQYLILPNQLLKVENGGKLDRYPYVYVQLFNDGNRGGLNIIPSNNPNSIFAIFKCPVDKYLYDNPSSFFTLKTTNKNQILHFRPDQDIRMRITLPSGKILQNNLQDYASPLSPNPFLQINALFTLLPIDKYDHIPLDI